MGAMVKSLTLFVLAVCFAVVTTGIYYHSCPPLEPAPEVIAMEAMDCHQMASSAPQIPAKKNCCTDFACPKCFSSPVSTPQVLGLGDESWHAAPIVWQEQRLLTHSPGMPERPPKMA